MKALMASVLGLGLALNVLAGETNTSAKVKLTEGMVAPDFEASSTDGGVATLAGYKGKWLVLYFYPKSFTPGCTKEACSLRDEFSDLSAMGASILGVSRDNLETQQKFKSEHQLPFELLADTEKKIARDYGVIGFGGLYQRRTFIIDPNGSIADILYGVTVNIHGEEVADALRKLQASKGK